MDRESSRLFREARRAQRNLRGPAGQAAAAELGRAAAQAASTEYTGRARDLQRGGLRQQAALAAGYRPAGNSLLGPTATLQPSPRLGPAAPSASAQPATPADGTPVGVAPPSPTPKDYTLPMRGLTDLPITSASGQTPANAAPTAPAPPADMVSAPLSTPKSLRRAAAAYSGTIGGGTTMLGDVAVGAADGVQLLTPEGASARIRREASARNVPRTDILDEINAERATVGQAPMKIDWQKDVLPYDVAKAEGAQQAAATLAGDATAAQAARELNVTEPPLFVGPPASAAAAAAPAIATAKPPVAAPTQAVAATQPPSFTEALGQDLDSLTKAVVDDSRAAAKATGKTLASLGRAAKGALSSNVATMARGVTSGMNLVPGETGRLLRKVRKTGIDSVYNATR